MADENVFQISIKDIMQLDETQAVVLFKKLLQAEAYKYRLPLSRFQISENTKEPDGGIDATVNFVSSEDINDLLKNGQANYQIKADDSFTSLSKGAILKELLGVGTIKELENLSPDETKNRLKQKPKIIETIEQGKYYVLVSFRTQATGTKKSEAITLIKNILIKAGYENPKIDIIDATNLQGFINQYLSVVDLIKKIPNGCYNIDEALNYPDLSQKYYESEEIKQISESIRKDIIEDNSIRHIRILADAGVGKTKTVLEIAENFSSIALYIENASDFEESGLFNYLQKEKNKELILILDECDYDISQTIWRKVKAHLPNIKLITISRDLYKSARDTDIKIIELPKMSDDIFKQILCNEYGLTKEQANHIALLCEGYPRLAHTIGKNYEINKTPLYDLDSILTNVVMGEIQDETKINKTLSILRYLSIFRMFGYSNEFKEEYEFIFGLIKEENPSISEAEYHSIIDRLKSQKILQNNYTLYITPKILHIWLYDEFWQNTFRKRQISEKYEQFPESLKKWFQEMFEYAGNSQAGIEISKEFLENFDYTKLADKNFSDFFLNLTKANPQSALSVLKNIFDSLSDEQVSNISYGRMNIIWAIQYIIFSDKLFEDAARILYKLAVNENDFVYSNNATGTFCQIFQMSLPGTEASLAKRSDFLQELYNAVSNEKELRVLLKVFDNALNADYFSRAGGVEVQGFEIKNDYHPKIYGEIFDYWQNILNLVFDCINKKSVSDEIRSLALEIIQGRSVGLLRYSETTQKSIIKLFEDLMGSENITKKELLSITLKIIRQLKFSKKDSSDSIKYFKDLKDSLLKYQEQDSLEMFLDIDPWSIADDIDELKNSHVIFLEKLSILVKAFWDKSSQDVKMEFLEKVIKNKYKNDFQLGIVLVSIDENFELLENIIDIYRQSENKDSLLIVGYLSELYKKNSILYDATIKNLYNDEDLYVLIPNINQWAFTTDTTARLTFDLIISGKTEQDKIKSFSYISENVPIDTIVNIIEFAIKLLTPESIEAALHILYHNKKLWDEEKISLDLIFDLLNNSISKDNSRNISLIKDDFIWGEIFKRYIQKELYTEKKLKIFETLIDTLTHRDNSALIYSNYISPILMQIIQQYPEKTWDIIKERLNLKMVILSPLKSFLRGNYSFEESPGAMIYFNIDDITNWIDDNTEERIQIIASCSPKDLCDGETSIMRNLLIKYGDKGDLTHHLLINFGNKGWMGKESDNIKKDIERLNIIKENDKNQNVLSFVNKYLEILGKDLKRALIREERTMY